MFTQDLYHEGSLLSSGIKYTVRTEAMYGHGSILADGGAKSASAGSPLEHRNSRAESPKTPEAQIGPPYDDL